MPKKDKKGHKSARAMKADQRTLSKDELKKDGEVAPLTEIVSSAREKFKTACIKKFGTRWWNRLSNSASDHKKTPLAYAIETLLK